MRLAKKRLMNVFLSGLAVSSLVLGFLLIKPLPVPLLKRVVEGSSAWILSDYMVANDESRSARLINVGQKLLATYLQHSLVAHFHRANLPEARGGDLETLYSYASAIQTKFLSDKSVDHLPAAWPVFFSGVGFCDQVNGVATEVLAFSFENAELFALFDPVKRQSPHTVGRVWSDELRQWLYFDVLYSDVLIYTMRDGLPQFLPSIERELKSKMSDAEYAALVKFYSHTEHGSVMNTYKRSFGAYLMAKVQQAVRSESLASLRSKKNKSERVATAGALPLRSAVEGKVPKPPPAAKQPAAAAKSDAKTAVAATTAKPKAATTKVASASSKSQPGTTKVAASARARTAAAPPAPPRPVVIRRCEPRPGSDAAVERAYLRTRIEHILDGRSSYAPVASLCRAQNRCDAICTAAALFEYRESR